MLDALRSNPAAYSQCINTTYRTNVDYITDTAKFVDLPRYIADYCKYDDFLCLKWSRILFKHDLILFPVADNKCALKLTKCC